MLFTDTVGVRSPFSTHSSTVVRCTSERTLNSEMQRESCPVGQQPGTRDIGTSYLQIEVLLDELLPSKDPA